MGISEIDMERIIATKKYHKNNFICVGINEKTHYIGATKRNYRKNWKLELVPNIWWTRNY